MSNTWFTADTHINHANIIRYCNRPFESVEKHNEAVIENINNLVQPNDTLYHLGDFSFGNQAFFRKQIRCHNVILIVGNHDPKHRDGSPKDFLRHEFSGCHRLLDIKVPFNGKDYSIVLCHYAMRVWNKSHHGAFHLYGHSHGTLPDDPNSLSFDVGVDCHEYKPISMSRVVEIMATKNWKPIDQHGRNTVQISG